MYIGPEFQALVQALRAEATIPLLITFAYPTLALKALRETKSCLSRVTDHLHRERKTSEAELGWQIHAEPDWTREPQGIRSLQMESTLPGTQAADDRTGNHREHYGSQMNLQQAMVTKGGSMGTAQGGLGSLRKKAYRRQDNSELRQASISCPFDLKSLPSWIPTALLHGQAQPQ